MGIGVVPITHVRNNNKIFAIKGTNYNKIFCFFTIEAAHKENNELLPKLGLLLKERICSQRANSLL